MSQAPSVVRFVLEVQDMPRAQAFYREAFGATVKGSGDFTILEFGGRTVNLSMGGRRRADTGLVPVDDPDAAIERYRELGFELSYRADDDSWIQLTDGTTTIALVPK